MILVLKRAEYCPIGKTIIDMDARECYVIDVRGVKVDTSRAKEVDFSYNHYHYVGRLYATGKKYVIIG